MQVSTIDEATRYRIRVSGLLGDDWSNYLDGMGMMVDRSTAHEGVTDLIGWVADQAALMGLLERTYAWGATLLSVQRLEPEPPGRAQSERQPGEERSK